MKSASRLICFFITVLFSCSTERECHTETEKIAILNSRLSNALLTLNFDASDSCIKAFYNEKPFQCGNDHQINFFLKNAGINFIYQEEEDSALTILNSIKSDSLPLQLTVNLLKAQIYTQAGIYDSLFSLSRQSQIIHSKLNDANLLIKFNTHFANQFASFGENIQAQNLLSKTTLYLMKPGIDSASLSAYYGALLNIFSVLGCLGTILSIQVSWSPETKSHTESCTMMCCDCMPNANKKKQSKM